MGKTQRQLSLYEIEQDENVTQRDDYKACEIPSGRKKSKKTDENIFLYDSSDLH